MIIFSTMFPLEGDDSGKGMSKIEDPAKDNNFKVNIIIGMAR